LFAVLESVTPDGTAILEVFVTALTAERFTRVVTVYTAVPPGGILTVSAK
jgi:hypothetical protein